MDRVNLLTHSVDGTEDVIFNWTIAANNIRPKSADMHGMENRVEIVLADAPIWGSAEDSPSWDHKVLSKTLKSYWERSVVMLAAVHCKALNNH